MKNISRMVEDALMDNITQDDIENAISNIIDGMDIEDMLSENDTLREAVYAAVYDKITACVEMYL